MLRSKEFYKQIRDVIIDIYQDYGIKTFPVDEFELCKKMGIVLVPFSSLEGEELRLAYKKSKDGFYVPRTSETPPMIYYNDNLEEVMSYGRIRYTIFHEIKHFIFDDKEESEENEDGAQYFAKYAMCPIPYLIHNIKKYSDIESIRNDFGVSSIVAEYLLDSVNRRMYRYGNGLFKREVELIDSIYNRDYDPANYGMIFQFEE